MPPRTTSKPLWSSGRSGLLHVAIGLALAVALVRLSSAAATDPHDALRRFSRPWQSGSRTTPDDARPFLGEWTSTLEGPSQLITLTIAIRIDGEKVLGTVASDLFAETKVDEITSTAKGIALRFRCEVWGYSGTMVLSLVPDDEHLDVELSLLNGQFNTSGVAKKKPAKVAA
jgi:hypothetical protein